MKRLFIFWSIVLTLVLIVSSPVFSEDRFSACDLCGYCPPNNPPSTWNNCRACIYPNASSDASAKDTLRLGSSEFQENIPPTPYPARHYTMIGCIRTNFTSFKEEGAAANVVQILLNVIFSVAGGLSFLYLMYGAFVVLTSQDDPERINHGKRILYGSIVGIIFTISSVFIINLLASGILKIPGFTGTTP